MRRPVLAETSHLRRTYYNAQVCAQAQVNSLFPLLSHFDGTAITWPGRDSTAIINQSHMKLVFSNSSEVLDQGSKVQFPFLLSFRLVSLTRCLLQVDCLVGIAVNVSSCWSIGLRFILRVELLLGFSYKKTLIADRRMKDVLRLGLGEHVKPLVPVVMNIEWQSLLENQRRACCSSGEWPWLLSWRSRVQLPSNTNNCVMITFWFSVSWWNV